jgi:hypothetical protein
MEHPILAFLALPEGGMAPAGPFSSAFPGQGEKNPSVKPGAHKTGDQFNMADTLPRF